MLPAKNKFCKSFRGVGYGQWIVEDESSASVSSLTVAEWSRRFLLMIINVCYCTEFVFGRRAGRGNRTASSAVFFFFIF